MATAATAPDQVPMATLMNALSREATARVRRAMRPLGVGGQQFMLMKQLQVLGQTSQAELADALALDPSNLAAMTADLAGRGLVERSRDDVDRRRYVLRLSKAGDRLLRRTEGAMAMAEADLLAPLDDEQRDQLYGLLRRLADGVELCPTPDSAACDE